MIERKILQNNVRNYQINNLLSTSLKRVGFSESRLKKTPLGEKITIVASRPGLVVGRKGASIKALTKTLKLQFKLENPQIEIEEVKNQNLDAKIVAEKIQSALERFGTKKFKGVGHKSMEDVISAGALGVEILLSGKIPSQRAKRWRFYKGYLKKSGDIAVSEVSTAYAAANLKSGTVGIQVRIMRPDTWLPDRVDVHPATIAAEKIEEVIEEVTEEGNAEEVTEEETTEDVVLEVVEKAEKKVAKKDTKKKTTKEEKIE
jgi:small subunit ribosomal protein S3